MKVREWIEILQRFDQEAEFSMIHGGVGWKFAYISRTADNLPLEYFGEIERDYDAEPRFCEQMEHLVDIWIMPDGPRE